MRNPVQLKNLRLRLLPFHLAGLLLLLLSQPLLRSIAVGVVPIVLGVGIRTWGAGHLVKTERFVVSGPYSHVRHPLYLGSFLITIGFALMLGGWASNIALIAAFVWFFPFYFQRKERIESSRLERLYGEAYARYRSEVPALLPRRSAWAGAPEFASRWSAARYDDNNELGTLLAVVAGIGLVVLRAALAA